MVALRGPFRNAASDHLRRQKSPCRTVLLFRPPKGISFTQADRG